MMDTPRERAERVWKRIVTSGTRGDDNAAIWITEEIASAVVDVFKEMLAKVSQDMRDIALHALLDEKKHDWEHDDS